MRRRTDAVYSDLFKSVSHPSSGHLRICILFILLVLRFADLTVLHVPALISLPFPWSYHSHSSSGSKYILMQFYVSHCYGFSAHDQSTPAVLSVFLLHLKQGIHPAACVHFGMWCHSITKTRLIVSFCFKRMINYNNKSMNLTKKILRTVELFCKRRY
jgi:hypothetical protein